MTGGPGGTASAWCGARNRGLRGGNRDGNRETETLACKPQRRQVVGLGIPLRARKIFFWNVTCSQSQRVPEELDLTSLLLFPVLPKLPRAPGTI